MNGLKQTDGAVGWRRDRRGRPEPLQVEPKTDPLEPRTFERLIRLVQENERLFDRLDANRAAAAECWTYLARPGSNTALALARLERLRTARSAILTRLRANRIEARELLGAEAPGAEPPWSIAALN